MASSKPQLQTSGLPDYLPAGFLEDALEIFCQTMGLSSNVIVSLVFCSAEEMQELNKKYRGVNSTTDVLSFSADTGSGLFPPDNEGNIYLGEILFDLDYIIQNEDNKDPMEALIPVFIHGLLHLLGFDHLNSRQKAEMDILERKLNILTQQE